MGAIVDPVTGLPLVSSTDLSTIDQIPLDSQVFPYSDLGATARPGRGPSYPDDVLPTTAIVTGMHNKAAQAVNTDGSNALWVYVVNSSGGGGGGPTPSVYADGGAFQGTNIAPFGGDEITINTANNVLYGYHWSACPRSTGTSGGSPASFQAYLHDPANGSAPFIRLAYAIWAAGSQVVPQCGDVSLATPIDLQASYGGASIALHIVINVQNFDLAISFMTKL